MRTALLIVAVLAVYGLHQRAMFLAEQRTISASAESYKAGWKDALTLNEPVHDDLEMACLTLWISEQNLLYTQKNPTEQVGQGKQRRASSLTDEHLVGQ